MSRDRTRRMFYVVPRRAGMSIPLGRLGTLDREELLPMTTEIQQAQRAGEVDVEPAGEGDPFEMRREEKKNPGAFKKRKRRSKAKPKADKTTKAEADKIQTEE